MGYGLVAGLFLLLSGIAASQVVRGVRAWRQKRLSAAPVPPAIDHDGPIDEHGDVTRLLDMLDDAGLAESVRRFSMADVAWREIEAGLPAVARARGEQLTELMISSCRRMVETPGLATSAEARRQLRDSLERVTELLQGHASDIQGKAVDEFVAELRAADRRSSMT